MSNQMFCFQCEQTAGCTGCTGTSGVCGKKYDTAELQDKLTGALIGLARSTEGNEDHVTEDTNKLVIESLFTTVTNVNFNNETINKLIDRIEAEKDRLVPNCLCCSSSCVRNNSYDMNELWNADEDIRSLKSLILFGIRGMAAYAYHAYVLGYQDEEVNKFFYKALFAIGMKDWGMNELLPVVMKVGEINLKCMALLDKANTETYGNPVPTEVILTVEKGPFIVISGHDLYDLKQLLEQTEGKGINIYTHGEMLPAHAYPELKKYGHLKGNFGTAWQNQQKEFADIPAPVLFTTNCLMPPKASYADRVFTTEVVSYPELVHIGEDKDFAPVIEKALVLGGYPTDMNFTGINGGNKVITGFANFEGSDVESLGKLEIVIGKKLKDYNGKLTDLKHYPVYYAFNIRGSKIKNLGKLKKVYGTFAINNQIESLDNLTYLGSNFYVSNNSLKDLGKLETVDGMLCLLDDSIPCQVTSLGNLKRVRHLVVKTKSLMDFGKLEEAKQIFISPKCNKQLWELYNKYYIQKKKRGNRNEAQRIETDETVTI